MDASIGWIIFIVLLGPVIGSILGVLIRPTNWFLCASFSFAAGIMLAISLMQLLPEALETISAPSVMVAFLAGFVIMYVVDKSIPHVHGVTDEDERAGLRRTSIALMVGISIHNLPEGFAVGASFSSDASLGLIVAIAISLHDLPETMIPVSSFKALGKSNGEAFGYGWLATLPTILGLAIGWAVLEYVSDSVIAVALTITAAIMIYISGDELIPAAQKLGYPHLANFSVAAGIIMVLGLGMIT